MKIKLDIEAGSYGTDYYRIEICVPSDETLQQRIDEITHFLERLKRP